MTQNMEQPTDKFKRALKVATRAIARDAELELIYGRSEERRVGKEC